MGMVKHAMFAMEGIITVWLIQCDHVAMKGLSGNSSHIACFVIIRSINPSHYQGSSSSKNANIPHKAKLASATDFKLLFIMRVSLFSFVG